MRLSVRLFLIAVLSLSVFGMGVHYDATDERHWPYPSSDDLAADYAAHVGEDAFLFGTVEQIDGDTAEILVTHTGGTFTLTVEGLDVTVQPGGTVQVVGELRPDRTMVASNVAVVNPAGSSKAYKYAVSLVGAVLVLVVFFREWQIDTEEFGFEVK